MTFPLLSNVFLFNIYIENHANATNYKAELQIKLFQQVIVRKSTSQHSLYSDYKQELILPPAVPMKF